MRKKHLMFVTAAMICSAMASHAATISKHRIAPEKDGYRGTLFVTVNGREKAVAKEVWNSWLIENGKAVVYSGSDGAGGFENEGQSLWRYDADSGRRKKLMSESYPINRLTQRQTRSGKIALVVEMSDGGLGAPALSVVHPRRGQVWRMDVADLIGVKNGRMAVGVFSIRDLENAEDIKTVKPRRMIYPDLDELLRRKPLKLQPPND